MGGNVVMESVMILGAGPLQVPAIMKAKELGMHVYVCDYDPHAAGLPLADEAYLISTVDQEAILRKATELHPDYVLTSTSDAPVRTAAYVCEQLDLPCGISYKDSVCATVKSAMRERLSEFNVPIPEFHICNNYESFINAVHSFKNVCIIKPSDSSASRGVTLISTDESPDDLKEQYDYCKAYSHKGEILVEEFMTGAEVSVECFVIDGITDIITITDKLTTKSPYFVELGHSEPSSLPEDIKKRICEVTIKAIAAIGIKNGVSHAELKITPEGPKIVEIAARLGGDHITSKLVPLSTGVDMTGNSLLLALGRKTDLTRTRKCGSAIRFITAKSGVLRKMNIDENIAGIDGVEEIEFYIKPGDTINPLHSSNDRIGHVITCSDTAESATALAEDVIRRIEIIVD